MASKQFKQGDEFFVLKPIFINGKPMKVGDVHKLASDRDVADASALYYDGRIGDKAPAGDPGKSKGKGKEKDSE